MPSPRSRNPSCISNRPRCRPLGAGALRAVTLAEHCAIRRADIAGDGSYVSSASLCEDGRAACASSTLAPRTALRVRPARRSGRSGAPGSRRSR
jgi:hypothetical protein